jgi:hypothetical protein
LGLEFSISFYHHFTIFTAVYLWQIWAISQYGKNRIVVNINQSTVNWSFSMVIGGQQYLWMQ